MNDYLEWFAAGLIFLWILGAYDARAYLVESGHVRCESALQSVFLPALSFPDLHARIDSAAGRSPRHDGPAATARLPHPKPKRGD